MNRRMNNDYDHDEHDNDRRRRNRACAVLVNLFNQVRFKRRTSGSSVLKYGCVISVSFGLGLLFSGQHACIFATTESTEQRNPRSNGIHGATESTEQRNRWIEELLEQQANPLLESQYNHLRAQGLRTKDRIEPAFNPLKANWPCKWGVDHVLNKVGDGAKWACGLNYLAELPDQECVVYSVGSNNNFGFEQALLKSLPHCKVFTFDPTVKEPRIPQDISEALEFRKWGVSGKDDGDYMLLTTIMRKLGHSHIDILKIDVEGHEFPTFFGMEEQGLWPSMGQLLIEIHPSGHGSSKLAVLKSIIELFEKHSLRMFHAEINPLSPTCSEYSFIQRTWSPLLRSYNTTEQ